MRGTARCFSLRVSRGGKGGNAARNAFFFFNDLNINISAAAHFPYFVPLICFIFDIMDCAVAARGRGVS